MPKLVAALAVTLCLVVAGTRPALGHTALVSSDPADGAQVETVPPTVEMTFSEDVDTGFVAVAAPDGTKLATSEPRISAKTMTADLAASDQHGTFTVAYRVVSDDGHTLTGAFRFTTTTGRHVTEEKAPEQESFADRHGSLLIAGLVVAMAAIAVMLMPLTRRRRGA